MFFAAPVFHIFSTRDAVAMRHAGFFGMQNELRRFLPSGVILHQEQQPALVGLQMGVACFFVDIECDPVFEDDLRRKVR